MRPDEHKKKKNAAYKKKHNLHTDRQSGSREKCETTSSDRLSDDSRRHVPTASGGQAAESAASKVYRRRKVESNWDKYEETVEAETELDDTRGASYEDVLRATCNVKTQFQFHRFHSSNDDDDGAELADGTADLLSIDCKRLVNSLHCVPLHQRLDIDESMFEKSEIDAFNAAAEEKWSRYKCSEGPTDTDTMDWRCLQTAAVADQAKSDATHAKGNVVSSTPTENTVTLATGNVELESVTAEADIKGDVTSAGSTFVNESVSGDDSEVNKADYHNRTSPSSSAGVDSSESLQECLTLSPSCATAAISASSHVDVKTISQLENELDSLLSM